MTAASLILIADAVTRAINQAELPLPFKAVRSHVVELNPEQLGEGIRVHVVPRTRTTENFDRSHVLHECQVSISVQQRLDVADHAHRVDALMALTEAIEAALRRLSLTDAAGEPLVNVRWRTSEVTLPYSTERLHTQHVFLSILTITYAVRE